MPQSPTGKLSTGALALYVELPDPAARAKAHQIGLTLRLHRAALCAFVNRLVMNKLEVRRDQHLQDIMQQRVGDSFLESNPRLENAGI